jgi:hypothetical protein
VIVKAERLVQGRNTRFIVINLAGVPQAHYDEIYCQRGNMENRIKEQRLGLFADRTCWGQSVSGVALGGGGRAHRLSAAKTRFRLWG